MRARLLPPGGRAESAAGNGGSRSAGQVQPIPSVRAGKGAAVPAQKKSYDLSVKDAAWLDTGIDVAAGETMNFAAKGKFTPS